MLHPWIKESLSLLCVLMKKYSLFYMRKRHLAPQVQGNLTLDVPVWRSHDLDSHPVPVLWSVGHIMISKGHMEPAINKTQPGSKTTGKNEGVKIETITLNLKLAVLTVSMGWPGSLKEFPGSNLTSEILIQLALCLYFLRFNVLWATGEKWKCKC